jgi:predicted DNA-binding helix-hairpin-helix protein
MYERLDYLASAAQFDLCGNCGTPSKSPLDFIHLADMPDGTSLPVLKVLLTNVCSNDCAYCINQVGRDIPRCSYQPDELAKTFIDLNRKGLARGLFLSSGVGIDATRTQDSMIKVAEILRRHYHYKGYIHLKILPGARFDSIEEACRLATRVSINIEAPTTQHLSILSTKKNLQSDILNRMRFIQQLNNKNENLACSGQSTQFVVGAAGEKDADILNTTEYLYGDIGLKRIYFSAFQPVPNSRLENVSATPPIREHRLYQADWLLRIYRFSSQELNLALETDGNLSLLKDPKFAIAQNQPWLFPIDVNTAKYEELLRVPGIGPVSARRIVNLRKDSSITSLQQLKKMRVQTKWALPFIWFKSMLREERQTRLPFDDDKSPDFVPSVQTDTARLVIPGKTV